MKKYSILVLAIMLGVTIPIFALNQAEIEQAYGNSFKEEKAGKFAEALKALAPIQKDYPAGYAINLRSAYLNTQAKKYQEGLVAYDKAIAAAPSSVEARQGIITILLAQGRFADAEAVSYQILNLDFVNYLANLRLVYALRMQKKFELAEKVASKMLNYYPVDAAFLSELGILKYAAGNFQKADTIFQDILTLDPSNLLAKDYLALIRKPKVETATLGPVPAAVKVK